MIGVYTSKCSCTYFENLGKLIFWDIVNDCKLHEISVSDGNDAMSKLLLWKDCSSAGIECKTLTPFYKNKENGEFRTYKEMIQEWREKYEGIDSETGFYRCDWQSRYEFIPPDDWEAGKDGLL